jgi:hypothetical protein
VRLIYAALADAEGATIGAEELSDEGIRLTARSIAARADEIEALAAGERPT